MTRFVKLRKKPLQYILIIVVFAGVTLMSTQESMAQPAKYDGTKGYVTLSLEHAFTSLLPAINNMTAFNFTGEIPVVVAKVGTPGFMTWDQITAAKNSGFTIMSHTETHLVLSSNTPNSTVYYEVVQSKIDLQNHGFNVTGFGPANDVITPYAQQLMDANYGWTRIEPAKPNTLYSLTHDGLKYGMPLAEHHYGVGNAPATLNNFTQVKNVIDSAVKNHTWVIFDFHRLTNDGTGNNSPPQLFWQVLQYLKQKSDLGDLMVGSVDDGLGFSKNSVIPSISVTSITNSLPRWNIDSVSVSGNVTNSSNGDTVTINWGDGNSTSKIPISGNSWGPAVHTYSSSAIGSNPNQVTAKLIGSDNSVKATSTSTPVIVQKHATVFWSLNVPASVTHGSIYSISGKLKDTTTGLFLPSKTVTFTATSPIVIPNALTDSTGTFKASNLVAPAAGSYNIQAKFAGDSLYTSSSSVIKVLKVT